MSDVILRSAFLSYSSRDRESATHLKERLDEIGISTWMDETQISGGKQFLNAILEGLKKVDFVIIWWTTHSSQSKWVDFEVNRAMIDEIEGGETRLIFCRADNTELPDAARHKHYIDFCQDYDAAFRQLCTTVGVSSAGSPTQIGAHIRNRVERLLNDLRNERIRIRDLCEINIIEHLEEMPRTGKLIRFQRYGFDLPLRSIFDHLLSVAHTADHLLATVNHGIVEDRWPDLAAAIAYHDLGEVMLGDIPSHTDQKDYPEDVFRSRSSDQLLLPFRDEKERERQDRVSNAFVDLFLTRKHRQFAGNRDSVMRGRKGMKPIRDFFIIVDRIDPIIAVWRYIHLFRPLLQDRTAEFVTAMADFFDNPDVIRVAESYCDPRVNHLTRSLLTVDYAKKFVGDFDAGIASVAETSGMSHSIVSSLLLTHLPRYVTTDEASG